MFCNSRWGLTSIAARKQRNRNWSQTLKLGKIINDWRSISAWQSVRTHFLLLLDHGVTCRQVLIAKRAVKMLGLVSAGLKRLQLVLALTDPHTCVLDLSIATDVTINGHIIYPMRCTVSGDFYLPIRKARSKFPKVHKSTSRKCLDCWDGHSGLVASSMCPQSRSQVMAWISSFNCKQVIVLWKRSYGDYLKIESNILSAKILSLCKICAIFLSKSDPCTNHIKYLARVDTITYKAFFKVDIVLISRVNLLATDDICRELWHGSPTIGRCNISCSMMI